MKRILTLCFIIVIAAVSRLLPHPPNFTPIAAMALFGGVYFTDKRFAFIIPLGAMFLSDMIIGFHNAMWAVYLSFALIAGIGFYLKKNLKLINIISATLISSLLFFLITNFAVWAGSAGYPQTPAGLALCYEMGLPFLRNSLLGDFFFAALLFGAFYFAEKKIPSLAVKEIDKNR